MSNVRGRFADLLRDAEGRYWESVFLGLIMAYTLVLVVTALGYGPDPRLFPLLIGVPLIALILVRIGMLLSDRIDVRSGGVFQEVTAELADAGEDAGPQYDTLERYRKQVEIVAWLCGFVALIWAIGFQLGLVIFVFTFVAIYEGDLRRALAATIIAYGVVYLLFVQLLSVSLYDPALLPDSIADLIPGFVEVVMV